MTRKVVKSSVKRYAKDINTIFAKNPMVVFLCGPSLSSGRDGALLRARLMKLLKENGFEVVLGEDDGLESLRKKYKGYAHLNELGFIEKECGAVVLIADSVGSYCELGLFSYWQTSENPGQRDFILIISSEYKGKASYLNEGPAKAISHYGAVYYEDLKSFDCTQILERLQGRRAISIWDRRGKPRK